MPVPSRGDVRADPSPPTWLVSPLPDPRLAALVERPFFRSGNVSRVELRGANEWSNLNHYLVILRVDIGIPRKLEDIVPPGGEMTIMGPYGSLESWERTREPEPTEEAEPVA